MSDPYIGEIRAFGFNFVPTGWLPCNGQLLSIAQNTALFALLGTTYGGDGKVTFALPNLQARAPLHFGQGPGLTERFQGESGGATIVTLLPAEMAAHTHTANADAGSAGIASPENTIWGGGGRGRPPVYSTDAPDTGMSPQALAATGDSQPHNNLPPYQAVNFCIALQGEFPSRG